MCLVGMSRPPLIPDLGGFNDKLGYLGVNKAGSLGIHAADRSGFGRQPE